MKTKCCFSLSKHLTPEYNFLKYPFFSANLDGTTIIYLFLILKAYEEKSDMSNLHSLLGHLLGQV